VGVTRDGIPPRRQPFIEPGLHGRRETGGVRNAQHHGIQTPEADAIEPPPSQAPE
jgi:hypothetical protein